MWASHYLTTGKRKDCKAPMIELHPKYTHSITNVLKACRAEPEEFREHKTETTPRPTNGAYPCWERVALWIFVFLSFAAFGLCIYLVLMKCRLN